MRANFNFATRSKRRNQAFQNGMIWQLIVVCCEHLSTPILISINAIATAAALEKLLADRRPIRARHLQLEVVSSQQKQQLTRMQIQ
ncbi:hypothetical protein ACVWY1_004514 [Pseudomonas sp. TE6288]|uniref:hypothetical protein n=1 Tax=unclassified Pseudomonas TaxID=196821 RepID=UPI0011AFBC89|nr:MULTISPECIES: hypothetical protein [unclassified Pseudomonas]